MDPAMDNLIDKLIEAKVQIAKELARVKIQQQDIKNYAGANLAYNHAADTANKLGLSETQKLGISPFPGQTTINVSREAQAEEQPKPKSWLWSAAGLVLAVLASGGVGSAITAAALEWMTTDPPPPQDPPAVAEEIDPNVGLEVEGWNSK